MCATWGLLAVQNSTLPALGQDSSSSGQVILPNKARVFVTSDPPGQFIILDGQRYDETTPTELDLNQGHHHLVVNAEGYQPLSHDMTIAAGQYLELEFILIKTPPEPPTAAELRALSPPFGADDPNSNYWAEAGPREIANESCRECHPSILKLHAQGEHRPMACESCHSSLSDHVKDEKVIGVMPVVRGEGIQSMCMMCHDRNNRNRTLEPARTVDLRKHLRELRVLPDNRCEQCHHVHDPMKWVHEAREIVGIPEVMASIPMLDEAAADEKRLRYSSMAEIFFVFPLVLGIVGMTALDGTEGFPSKTFLVSGVVLVAGSYLLGERARSKELEKIRALNDERRATNAKVKEHNLRVEEAMDQHNQAVQLWISESEGRGVVNIDWR